MITILTTSQNPKKKPWSWLLIRWCTWGVSKENYGLIWIPQTIIFWDLVRLLGYLQVGFHRVSSAILTLLLHTQCMLSWLLFFSHCRTNVTQSSQSIQKYWKLKCVSIRGAIFLGAIPPFTNERNRIMEQHYLGFRAQARIILEFWPKDWSTFGFGFRVSVFPLSTFAKFSQALLQTITKLTASQISNTEHLHSAWNFQIR